MSVGMPNVWTSEPPRTEIDMSVRGKASSTVDSHSSRISIVKVAVDVTEYESKERSKVTV